MKINESQALEIASRSAREESEQGHMSIDIDDYTIKLEDDDYAQSLFGLEGAYWSATFRVNKADNAGATFDPDYIAILVDAETGEAYWVPEAY